MYTMTKVVEQNSDAVDSNSDSVVGDGAISVGNDSLEAPKWPRPAVQIPAFEKARAKRADFFRNSRKTSKKTTKKVTSYAPPPPQKFVVPPKRNLKTIKEREGDASSNTKRNKIRFKKRKRCHSLLRHILSLFDSR